jgi:hypothetical protein
MIKTCPFKPDSDANVIRLRGADAPQPSNACISACSLFIAVQHPDGKPAGGGCAFTIGAAALHNLQGMVAMQATPQVPPAAAKH